MVLRDSKIDVTQQLVKGNSLRENVWIPVVSTQDVTSYFA
jgi:hypothetical protein